MVVVLEVGIVFFIHKITTYKSYTVMWAVAMYHITHPILTYYLFIVSNVYLAGDTSLKSKKTIVALTNPYLFIYPVHVLFMYLKTILNCKILHNIFLYRMQQITSVVINSSL